VSVRPAGYVLEDGGGARCVWGWSSLIPRKIVYRSPPSRYFATDFPRTIPDWGGIQRASRARDSCSQTALNDSLGRPLTYLTFPGVPAMPSTRWLERKSSLDCATLPVILPSRQTSLQGALQPCPCQQRDRNSPHPFLGTRSRVEPPNSSRNTSTLWIDKNDVGVCLQTDHSGLSCSRLVA
jgi:hypothetical protein